MSKKHQFPIEFLPSELRQLVRKASEMLGITIKTYEGNAFYKLVESYRQRLKMFRISGDVKLLNILYRDIKKLKPDDLMKVAHAFSTLLELMNVCEVAYRTWNQRHKRSVTNEAFKIELNYVLTAHPTESRSNDVVKLLRQLTDLFADGMYNGFIFNESKIMATLGLLWHYPLVKTKKTTVQSEAEYIYSIVFSHKILDFILDENANYSLRISTWVGGDKDGHPGINEKVMLKSLSLSRTYFVNEIKSKLNQATHDLSFLQKTDKKILNSLNALIIATKKIAIIKSGDGKRVATWKRQFQKFTKSVPKFVTRHHHICYLERMLNIYSALVIPIELRDSSTEIAKATVYRNSPIRKMLSTLKRVSVGMEITAYVHGLIISHCTCSADLTNATKLVSLAANTKKLPVLPLFEDKIALDCASSILNEWLSKSANLNHVKKYWHGKLEIMLGYSDSAKQMGMLPSRYMLRESMFNVDKLLKQYGLTPVFFHGSGGSVERGGGSIQEQIAWWPDSAIKAPKLTVQGEMVQRRFSTPEILNSECMHLGKEARIRRGHKVNLVKSIVLKKFVTMVEDAYVSLVSDTKLLNYCLQATPYKYLSVLKLGSRPTNRPEANLSLSSLRAIPWILSWTQTRLLFPAWWGIGSAWLALSKAEQQELQRLYISDPFFSSFVKTLGFTLAKVEMPIWREYLDKIHGNHKAQQVYQFFADEYSDTLKFMQEVSQSSQLLSHRPWLDESIRLRSPYVHLLNLMQIFAIKTHNENLLKETLVGIACGMLTTG